MASKGERTKTFIIKRSAKVFNQRGYWGTSIADLVKATGLERGGIYNHFSNKDEIAIEAFNYAHGYAKRKIMERVNAVNTSNEKLKTLANSFMYILDNPELPGGCAILNTAIVSDDTHLPLKEKARDAMTDLQSQIRDILEIGIQEGEFKEGINLEEFIVMMVSMLEGGVMMSKLYDSEYHLQSNIQFLHAQIDALSKL